MAISDLNFLKGKISQRNFDEHLHVTWSPPSMPSKRKENKTNASCRTCRTAEHPQQRQLTNLTNYDSFNGQRGSVPFALALTPAPAPAQ